MENVLMQRENKVLYVDNGTRVKLFNEDFSKVDVLNEAYNQAAVENVGLNVPKVLEVMKIDGKWAIRTEYVEGQTLCEIMKEDPENYDQYLEEFVDLQLKVLKTKAPFGLKKLKDKMQAKISQTAPNLDATERYELHTRLDALPEHKCLCHGDFYPSNIVYGTDGKKYILDWSHVTSGNMSADAARTFLLFATKDGDIDLANKYLRLFCKKSDIALQYVQQWIPIVAASQSVKDNENEKELLLRWANVVDYD